MNVKNDFQRGPNNKNMTWLVIVAVILLMSISLGGLIYAFLIQVP